MNKAITDGLTLNPPAFEDGLTVWSRTDGTPGSEVWDGQPNAAVVAGDGDFGTCLEMVKTSETQSVRYMGETPILPGCYLRVSVRIKSVSGALPEVRVAGWAGGSGDANVGTVVQQASAVPLTAFGDVVEVSAIIGSGARTGVDLVWGDGVLYGHLGFDLTGATGGVVRIDDLQIEDVTSVFHRNLMDWVDVTDFGAIGDGVADDSVAFIAANAAAAGRSVLAPEGLYRLGASITMTAPTRFVGRVVMDDADKLILRGNFDLPAYIEAFEDEEQAFRKAFQALLSFTDHESLDLGGRRIEVSVPMDLAAAAVNTDTYEIRRVIRNGQFNVVEGAAWDPEFVTSQATYDAANPRQLTNVVAAGSIRPGALVEGQGVGREVRVTSVNVGAATVELSQPLHGAPLNQSYSFTRHAYVLDFSGFTKLSNLTLTDVEIACNGAANGVLLAPAGEAIHFKDCAITEPRHRAVSSHGHGCQGLRIDRCLFRSDEANVAATDRISLALNANADDIKLRDNRFESFGTTMVLHGEGHLISGNHWVQGDSVVDGPRVPGLVLTSPNVNSVLTGNSIDNCFVEWTNEHDATPDFDGEETFGGLSLTGNVFTVDDAAPWFAWLVIKPFGAGHSVDGLSVFANTFKSNSGTTDRVERVDDSVAELDFAMFRNITFEGNAFTGVDQPTVNPVSLAVDQAAASPSWSVDVSGYLPFGGWANVVTGVSVEGAIETIAGAPLFVSPQATVRDGVSNDRVRLEWPEAVRGRVIVTARTDQIT